MRTRWWPGKLDLYPTYSYCKSLSWLQICNFWTGNFSKRLNCIFLLIERVSLIIICVIKILKFPLTIADWSPTLMIGSLFRKSQTTTREVWELAARIWPTCLFHFTQLIWSGGFVFGPGTKPFNGFFKSHMSISELPEPLANRWFWNLLRSMDCTGPLWSVRVWTRAFSSFPANIAAES